jgi:hypothetical protein
MGRRREAGCDAVAGIFFFISMVASKKSSSSPPAMNLGDFRMQTGNRYITLIRKQN